jgi:phosphoglycerate dehydrogenase-like enzyme
VSAPLRILYWPRAEPENDVLAQLSAPNVSAEVIRSVDELAAALPGADGLVTMDFAAKDVARISALLREPSTTLRWLHVWTAGREGVVAANVPEHITITGAAGAQAPAVAQQTLAYMLAFSRRTKECADLTHEHHWDLKIRETMGPLEGRTLLLVGLGNAGREIAKAARAFEMHVVALTRNPKPNPDADEVLPVSALHEQLPRADYIVLMIALAPETRKLIGARELALCKPTAVLVNMARGEVIDAAALLAALQNGTIAGAALDVTEPEPLPGDDPLWTAPNIIIGPHVGGIGTPRTRMAGRVGGNLQRFLDGTLVPT